MTSVDVAIVGGGIAGLVAANYAARAGRSVVLFERSAALGGRAQTTVADGAKLNLGPHALYRGGAGAAVRAELGITLKGGLPGRYQALHRDRLHTLPIGGLTLARTGLLGPIAKVEFARTLKAVMQADAETLDRVTLREWAETHIGRDDVRAVFYSLVRLTTYAHAPDLISAGAVFRQLRLPGGVTYLDGGWTTLVEALRARAVEAGAVIESSQPVRGVSTCAGAATGLVLAGGRELGARAVIVATPPGPAAEITGVPAIARWAREVISVRSAVLDLALAKLPRPRRAFALGIDTPIYFSDHSSGAELGPRGSHVIHLAKYLEPGERGVANDEAEMEAVMDLVQPGWRQCVSFRRFLPDLVVTGALPLASEPGPGGRPPVAVPGFENLFVAGDWVGAEGMLADAAFASGKLAAGLAVSAKMATLVPA